MRWQSISLALVAMAALPAHAEDFYRGKQIAILVGFTAGGTYDATARRWARHLGRHIPGNPTVIVRNMPGSGSLVAVNHLYNTAPKDGTTLAVVGGGTVLEPLLDNAQAKYDPRRFNWIGGRSRDNFLCAVWKTSPVNTIEDAMKRDTVVGATGPGSRTLTYPKALNQLIGTRFKIVPGYPGGNEITLALERGEVEGYCGWALGSITNRAPQWLTDGTIKVLTQFTLGKADLPNVPLARDLPASKTGRQVIDLLSADSVLAWPLLAPPEVPAARLAELRAGFIAAMRDPELIADAAKLHLELDAVSADEMQNVVRRVYAAPPGVVDLVKKIVAAH
jgi:tripartite-type tricarboxylate transporter receptor subunit TctC